MDNLILNPMQHPSVESLGTEVVERKGLGHPDTICDSLAEELSRSLCRLYFRKFGKILHHNVDKILLAGGGSRPRFGGGKVTAPIELFLAGRAAQSYRGVVLPLEDLAMDTVRDWFRRNLPEINPVRDLRVHFLWRPTSQDLAELFTRARKRGDVLANDTSIGIGFAPLSRLESLVLSVEERIQTARTRGGHPEYGADVKVMGIRRGGRVSLTVPCAFVDRHVRNLRDYREKKQNLVSDIGRGAESFSFRSPQVEVNTADRGNAIYLTVTGTSAESGDDGEVGRGNRANGLITPFRPMTLEAFSGKNPVTHTGKLYQNAAQRIADRLASLEDVEAAECCLVSQIGKPIRKPSLIDVRLRRRKGGNIGQKRKAVLSVVEQVMEEMQDYWKDSLVERRES